MTGRPRLLIVNPNTSASVTCWLAEEARRVAGKHVEVTAVNAPSGLAAIETPDDLVRAAEVVIAAIEADTGADAAIIGAFGDPGLMEARPRLPIPVVGLGEAGLRAAENGRRFSIVTLGEAMRAPIVKRVRSLGLEDRLAEVSDFARVHLRYDRQSRSQSWRYCRRDSLVRRRRRLARRCALCRARRENG